MHPGQNGILSDDVAIDERDVFVVVHVIGIADDPEIAELGGQPCLGDTMHQAFRAQAVRDQLRHGDER